MASGGADECNWQDLRRPWLVAFGSLDPDLADKITGWLHPEPIYLEFTGDVPPQRLP